MPSSKVGKWWGNPIFALKSGPRNLMGKLSPRERGVVPVVCVRVTEDLVGGNGQDSSYEGT